MNLLKNGEHRVIRGATNKSNAGSRIFVSAKE